MVSLSIWRRISQFIFLALFIIFLYETAYPLTFTQTNLFVRSSPLVMVITFLVTHSLSFTFLPAVLLVVATLFLGRFFCGWICPVGTISDVIPRTKKRFSHHRFKYYFLVFALVSALFGVNLLIISDPLVIFTRSLVFISQSAIPFMLIFIIVVVLLLGERFWCRTLCPLGGFLGALSITRLLNLYVNENCTTCNLCSKVCPMDAIKECAINKTECTFCLTCVDKCPQHAITFTKEGDVTLESRRTFLKAGAAAGAAVLLSPFLTRTPSQRTYIRPPGALKEGNFQSVCARCAECMRVCPSQGLRPVLLEGGLSSFYTPKLVPRIGRCELCMLCWQVCPTGALVKVDPAKMKIGTATINRNLCIVWRDQKVCFICQEVCPYQAVEVVEGGKGKGNGEGRKGPQVKRTVCAGCGACENACPVEPAAITVSNEGEIRY